MRVSRTGSRIDAVIVQEAPGILRVPGAFVSV